LGAFGLDRDNRGLPLYVAIHVFVFLALETAALHDRLGQRHRADGVRDDVIAARREEALDRLANARIAVDDDSADSQEAHQAEQEKPTGPRAPPGWRLQAG